MFQNPLFEELPELVDSSGYSATILGVSKAQVFRLPGTGNNQRPVVLLLGAAELPDIVEDGSEQLGRR